MNTKANGELTPKEQAQRGRLRRLEVMPAVRRTTRQKFLFKDTQVYATQQSIQRVRGQCIQWCKPTWKSPNGRCNLNRVQCKPSVCLDFVEKV